MVYSFSGSLMEPPENNQKTSAVVESTAGWRLKSGVALFLFSIVLPVAGIPLVAGLDLSVATIASISGVLLVGAEVLGLLAVAVMGKPGYLYFKNLLFGLSRRLGPPGEVSRTRYKVGLIMFSIPILFGWVAPYISKMIHLEDYLVAYAITGDVLLLASLFVLGGDFWDKIRGLFVHNSKLSQPSSPESTD
jgi:hypothetical protein